THHSLAQQLRERGWGGYADSAGNASLRGNGLFVDITGRRDTGPAAAVAATAPYTRAGLPVTFALLASAEHFVAAPTQRAQLGGVGGHGQARPSSPARAYSAHGGGTAQRPDATRDSGPRMDLRILSTTARCLAKRALHQ